MKVIDGAACHFRNRKFSGVFGEEFQKLCFGHGSGFYLVVDSTQLRLYGLHARANGNTEMAVVDFGKPPQLTISCGTDNSSKSGGKYMRTQG